METINRNRLLEQSAKWKPWHSPIDLGLGVITGDKKKQYRFARRLRLLQIPENLQGKQALDIGSWDGFFTWEMEKRGADVMSIDVWNDVELEKYKWVHEVKNSKAQYKRLDVLKLNPESEGSFDLILFAGVLYHLRYPLATLESIRKVCRGQLILETVCMIPAMHGNFPMIAFFPGDAEAKEKKRQWGISGAATIPWLREALLSAGFCKVEVKHSPSATWWKKMVAFLLNQPQSGRVVIHAFV